MTSLIKSVNPTRTQKDITKSGRKRCFFVTFKNLFFWSPIGLTDFTKTLVKTLPFYEPKNTPKFLVPRFLPNFTGFWRFWMFLVFSMFSIRGFPQKRPKKDHFWKGPNLICLLPQDHTRMRTKRTQKLVKKLWQKVQNHEIPVVPTNPRIGKVRKRALWVHFDTRGVTTEFDTGGWQKL